MLMTLCVANSLEGVLLLLLGKDDVRVHYIIPRVPCKRGTATSGEVCLPENRLRIVSVLTKNFPVARSTHGPPKALQDNDR